MTFSDYKSCNTMKALICITPDGYISFVSHLFTGSKSDNEITMDSGILDCCQQGNALMADKGFTIPETELQWRGITMIHPSFFSAAEHASKEKVLHTVEVANERI